MPPHSSGSDREKHLQASPTFSHTYTHTRNITQNKERQSTSKYCLWSYGAISCGFRHPIFQNRGRLQSISLLPSQSSNIKPMFKLVPFFLRAPSPRDPCKLWQTDRIVRSRPGSEELAPASYAGWAPTKLPSCARSIHLWRISGHLTHQTSAPKTIAKHPRKITTANQPTSQPYSSWVHWIFPSLSESQIEVPMHSCAAPGPTSTATPTWVPGFRCLASWRGTCKCGLWYVMMEYAAFIFALSIIVIVFPLDTVLFWS